MPALVASIAAGNGCHGDLDIPRSHVGISCFFADSLVCFLLSCFGSGIIL
jgi:hypothetical protein